MNPSFESSPFFAGIWWSAVAFLELIVYVFDIGEEMAAGTFPAGLRVLAVDDDRICLSVLESREAAEVLQLQRCVFLPS